jgi:hypothetical protein
MREFLKFTLKELENDPARMSRAEMRATLAGGESSVVYTFEQMDAMVQAGTWTGGYVEGMGYMAPPTSVAGDNRLDLSGSQQQIGENILKGIARWDSTKYDNLNDVWKMNTGRYTQYGNRIRVSFVYQGKVFEAEITNNCWGTKDAPDCDGNKACIRQLYYSNASSTNYMYKFSISYNTALTSVICSSREEYELLQSLLNFPKPRTHL